MNNQISAAFFIFIVYLSAYPAHSMEDCKYLMSTSVCYIKAFPEYNESISELENIENFQNLNCEIETQKYLKILLELYERLPKHTQQGLCYIKRIYVVDGNVDFGGRAFVSYNTKSPLFRKTDGISEIGLKINGLSIALSKKHRFDNYESVSQKNERFLKEKFNSNKLSDIATLEYSILNNSGNTPSTLESTLIHEVGHVFDISNSLSDSSEWLNFSWLIPPSSSRFAGLRPNVNEALWNDDYSDLEPELVIKEFLDSSFKSLYAMTSPAEDFAEHYFFTVIDGQTDYIFDRKVYQRNNVFLGKKTAFILNALKTADYGNYIYLEPEWFTNN